MKQVKGLFIIVAALAALIVGCGYHFNPAGEHIDQKLQTVFIDTFGNNTNEANLETYIRNAFIDEFRKGSRFTVIADKKAAHTILEGTVMGISTTHISYRSDATASEDRATVTVGIVLKTAKSGAIIWANSALSENETYAVSTNTSTTENNERTALQTLTENMAKKAYRNIMSGF